jgi:LacI family transcriptional regulator, galactose operon repressor
VTLEEVAKRAGVSTATVSRVLNNTGPVREATRRRVLSVARQLRYQPNLHARSLAGGKSRVIGMVSSNIENPFFVDIFRSLETECARHGYEVVLKDTGYDAKRLVEAVHSLMGHRIAGLALVVSEVDAQLVEELKEHGLPCVFYDIGETAENISRVKVRYETGTRRMAEHLYSMGHRRMAFVGHHASLGPLHERQSTFLDVMRGHSGEVEFATVLNSDSPQGGRQAVQQILRSDFKPTAILCVNDFMAIGVLRELREQGLQVPQQVSVAGFDNITLSEYVCPALTTVGIPRRQIGQLVAEALISPDGTKKALGQEILIDPELVVRESTGAAPRL